MSTLRSSRSDEAAGGEVTVGEGWAACRGEGVAMSAGSDSTRSSPDNHDESAPVLEGPFAKLYRKDSVTST